MRPWPAWLVFLLFVPLQIYFAIRLFGAWGFWPTAGTLLLLGIIGNRAARAPWLMSLMFPGWAWKRESRRHIFQGILFLGAAIIFLLRYGPVLATLEPPVGDVPLLSVMAFTTLVKAAVR